jgi:AhpD family alkylhydroperoxidase
LQPGIRPETLHLNATRHIEPFRKLRWGMEMAQRLSYGKAFPEGIHALLNLGKVLKEHGLEPSLIELIKIRASQMNGCAYCIDMHTRDARALGETEQRIYALSAWRETPFFTARERAALGWTEAITNIQQGHASDEAYEEVRPAFSEEELTKLTLSITYINAWNRVALAFRAEPGSYQPKAPSAA